MRFNTSLPSRLHSSLETLGNGKLTGPGPRFLVEVVRAHPPQSVPTVVVAVERKIVSVGLRLRVGNASMVIVQAAG